MADRWRNLAISRIDRIGQFSTSVKAWLQVTTPVHYPRIAWVIVRHQGGLIRHMYIARFWPTINTGSA